MLVLIVAAGCRLAFDRSEPEQLPDAKLFLDAPVVPVDAAPCSSAACAAAGGTCVNDTCEIVEKSERLVTCPAGVACRVICDDASSRPCRDGVRCGGAPSCDVRCIGYRACQAGVDCAGAACAVVCNGSDACENGITVGPVGQCTSHCCGPSACAGGVATCTNDNSCS